MAIGDSLRISDIAVPEGAKLLDDPEAVVLTDTPPTRVEEPEEEVEEEALEGEEDLEAEGAEAPEGEAGEAETGGEEPAES
jgi:hypothetical protein